MQRIAKILLAVMAIILIARPTWAAESGQAVEPKVYKPNIADLVVSGKLYYFRKDHVGMPYPGTIQSLEGHSGMKVKHGDVLARYTLNTKVSLDLLRQLSPFHIEELKLKQSQLEQQLEAMKTGRKFAATQRLMQMDAEMEVLEQQLETVKHRLKMEQEFFNRSKNILQSDLKVPVTPYEVPREAILTAGIDGHVIFVNPEVRIGAGFGPGQPVFIIGIMDPMILRAQVHEMEAVELKVGDQAYFVLESMPEKKFPATITDISWTPTTQAIDQPSYYQVQFNVPNPDFVLKEGFRGKVYFKDPFPDQKKAPADSSKEQG